MSESKWFVADSVFHANRYVTDSTFTVVTERLLFLVTAVDQQSATERAVALAHSKEHSYTNAAGQPVRWSFVRLLDVTECIDQQFEDGAELKSIMTDEVE